MSLTTIPSSSGNPGSSDAVRSAAKKEMRRLKKDALEKGEVTDCSFMVGPDKEKAEVNHFII